MINDILLIKKIKEDNDQNSFIELVNRHTGVYNTIVYKYLHTGNLCDYHDLIDERDYNFFNFIKLYDPNRNTKFSTFVGERTKFLCLNKNTKNISYLFDEITDGILYDSQPDTDLVDKDIMRKLREHISKIENNRFKKIMELRFFSDEKILTFREVAEKMGITAQYVHKIYQDNIEEFISKFKEDIKN